MREATYITHTSNGHRYIRDKKDTKYDDRLARWFETELPGDDIATLRETLIQAAARLSEAGSRLLAANGFIVHEISLEPDDSDSLHIYYMFLTRTEGYDSHKAVLSECEKRGITPGYADIHKTLAVMEFLQCGTYKLLR